MSVTATSHLDPDLLSAYVDGELTSREAARVEAHLGDCPGCSARLDGLHRVVRALGRLERAAPPTVLAQRVEHRVALEARRSSLMERLEGALGRRTLDSPILVSFVLVLALAAIVYLFSGVAGRRPRGDVSLRVTPAEAARELLRAVEITEAGGHRFQLHGGVWREVDLGERAPDETVQLGGAGGAAFRERHPWLDDLLAEGEAVVFRDGDRVVEVRSAPPPVTP